MGLYERLLGSQEPKIPVHQFMSMLGELERGKVSSGQAATAFNLSAAEQTEAGTLINKIITPREAISLGALVTLSNIGSAYDGIAASQGLPCVKIQMAGIKAFEFTVRVNKIGSGTQSWQLWNETDGSQVTVIDDAAGTGVKALSVTETFGSPLGPGFKLLRIRAKSTTAADDPLFLGGCLLINRVEKLTSEELHQILLLGESGISPYATAAEIKLRLGV